MTIQLLPTELSSAALVLTLGALLAACTGGSQSPASPSAAPAAGLQPGVYAMSFTGVDLSDTPSIQPCTPLGVPRAGKLVSTAVRLERASSGWRVRGENPADGTFELRLEVNDGVASSRSATGSLQGTLTDAGSPVSPPNGVQVRFGEGSRLEGQLRPDFSNGRVTGSIVFADETGNANCSSVTWTLQPAR
jgi:hypothetical protein